jgi:hypothetical protein
MARRSVPAEGEVTPADIRAKLAAAPIGIAAGIGTVVLLLLLAYLFGRRRGNKSRTVVEIRRI